MENKNKIEVQCVTKNPLNLVWQKKQTLVTFVIDKDLNKINILTFCNILTHFVTDATLVACSFSELVHDCESSFWFLYLTERRTKQYMPESAYVVCTCMYV